MAGWRETLNSLRGHVYAVVEGGRRGYPAGRAFDVFLIVIIILNVAAVILGTEPEMPHSWHRLFDILEDVVVAVFTVEYVLRVWTIIEDPRQKYQDPVRGRLRWIMSPLAIIDVLAFVPFYLSSVVAIDATLAGLLRMVRLIKLLRFTTAFHTLASVVYNERRPLTAAFTVMGILVITVSTLAYLAEREMQPDKFGSIPQAMWWGLVTLSTVGYGDLTPITPFGRVVGGLATILGVACFAMPAGILASGFIDEIRRRQFVVTWNMVARVPLFKGLPAARIAGIAVELQLQVVQPHEAVVRKGDPADRMFFVSNGELEVELIGREPAVLRTGDFFGEMGLLEGGVRTATVTARTRVELMVLEASDFHRILEDNPDLAAAIREIVDHRRGSNAAAAAG